jgi:hypothetical protein
MYRIYLKWPESRVSEKTVTASPAVAEAAFRALLEKSDLKGKEVAAVLSLDGKGLEYRRFDRPEEAEDGLRPKQTIRLFHQ